MTSNYNPAYLFLSTPPTDDRFVKVLFHNREPELASAMATLSVEQLPRQLWAVHGPTRSGKSHFARRLLLEVRERGLSYSIVTVDANNKGSARAVLVSLFTQLLEGLPASPPRDANAPDQIRYRDGRRDCFVIKPLVEGLLRDVVHEVQTKDTRSEGTEAGLKIGPQWFALEARARHGTETSEARTQRVSLREPSDPELVQWLELLLDLHRIQDSGRRMLFLIDDVDLLARDGAEGAAVSQQLFDRLHALAQHPHGVVMLTVRQQSYNGREKEFQELASIDLWTDPEDILEVYRKHIETFNRGESIFHESALGWLARNVEGRVGMFLQLCRELSQKVLPRDRPIDDARLRGLIQDQVHGWNRQPELVYLMATILEAVRAGQMQVTFSAELDSNPLLQRVLIPIVGKANSFSISRVYFEALRAVSA